MPPKKSILKSEYKKIKNAELDKLKNGDIQKVKLDLNKINLKKIAERIGVLSGAVKLYMYLPASKRYYALNDRTINLLMGGDVDMSVTVGKEAVLNTWISDAELADITVKEKCRNSYRV